MHLTHYLPLTGIITLTKHPQDIVKSGQGSKEPEIEITEAMIAAGISAMDSVTDTHCCTASGCGEYCEFSQTLSDAERVAAVYRAMASQATRSKSVVGVGTVPA